MEWKRKKDEMGKTLVLLLAVMACACTTASSRGFDALKVDDNAADAAVGVEDASSDGSSDVVGFRGDAGAGPVDVVEEGDAAPAPVEPEPVEDDAGAATGDGDGDVVQVPHEFAWVPGLWSVTSFLGEGTSEDCGHDNTVTEKWRVTFDENGAVVDRDGHPDFTGYYSAWGFSALVDGVTYSFEFNEGARNLSGSSQSTECKWVMSGKRLGDL